MHARQSFHGGAWAYMLRRLLLVLPTLLGIVTINFFVVQMAPGGPVEQYIARLEGDGAAYMERIGAGDGGDMQAAADDRTAAYKGAAGLSPQAVEAIRRQYGFDRPILERYVSMLGDFALFRFGDSLFKGRSVIDLVGDAMPVSLSLGLWSTLVIYAVSIPLGMARALRRGSRFDTMSGIAVIAAHAIPAFLLAVLLIVLFAGGSYLQWFPLRGLVSPGHDALPFGARVLDYAHHMVLPVTAMVVGGFAGLTSLTRNAFLDELGKAYVETALAKGLTRKAVLWRHVFRNAMLLVISGLPGAFVRVFFTGSLLIETIFSLNGLGLMGFEAAMQRDYPVMFASLYVFTLIGLTASLAGDMLCMAVDPRIDFERRAA